MLKFIENTGGGAFIRFSVEDNEWLRSSEDGGLEAVDMASAPVLIDIENIQQGWLKLAGGRDWIIWPNNDVTQVNGGKQPEGEYKQGFSLKFYSTKLFGDMPSRELCTSGAGLIKFVQALYEQTIANFGSGSIPAVKITGSTKVKMGKGNSRIPTFEIVGWKPRPIDLESSAAAADPVVPETPSAGASDNENFDV